MAVPKQRKTKSRRNQRRMHIHLKLPTLHPCSKCGKPTRPHVVCLSCGYYKGRVVIDVLKKLTKKEKKQKEKELAGKEAGEKKADKKPMSWQGMSKK